MVDLFHPMGFRRRGFTQWYFRDRVKHNGVLVEGFYKTGSGSMVFWFKMFHKRLGCIFVEGFQPIKLFAPIKYICIM